MSISFDGIRERLKRANESLRNLDGEIESFIKHSDYPVLTDQNGEFILEAIRYHEKRPIPLRFSVLAGEIIHHLRSCLDHVAWQFSGDWYRSTHPTQIEFPILEVLPMLKKGGTGFERKVKGIANPAALILIEFFQPYHAAQPANEQLAIIHKMDIADKHRDLVLCASTGAFQIPVEIVYRYLRYKAGEPGAEPVNVADEFERHGKTVAQVAFRNFGTREVEPVAQGVMELYNFTVRLVGQFDLVKDLDWDGGY